MIRSNKVKILISTISTLFTLGCAQNISSISADKFNSKVEITNSEFDSEVKYVGPRIHSHTKRGLLSGGDRQEIRLRGWKDKLSGEIRHQLYISIKYSDDWRYYYSASFTNGKSEELTVVDREVVGCKSFGSMGVICDYKETLGLSLSNTSLSALKEEGLKVRINAKSGHENILELPANYIKGYLQSTIE